MNYSDEEIDDIKTYLAKQREKDDKKKSIGNKFDDFEPIKELGSGNFGTAFQVKSKINNEIYAMKIVNLGDLDNPDSIRLALNESKFLRLLSNPHIIKYYNSFQEGDYLYIIEEYAENGDLTNLLKKHKESGKFIKERKLWDIFLQCIEGIAYIHKVGAIHRDIKSKNIFFDKNMNIKIGDFGTSALMEKINTEKKENIKYLNKSYLYFYDNEEMMCHGTKIYSDDFIPPEMEEGTGYDQKIDVYSMGVTFHEMCYLYTSEEEWGCEPEKVKAFYSKEMIDLIDEMTEKNKEKRKTSKYFLEKIQKIIYDKYIIDTDIDSVLRCLYIFKDITNYYTKLEKKEFNKKPITKAYISCLKKFTKKDMIFYLNSIKSLKEKLCEQYEQFDKEKGIDPRLLLTVLIRQLYNEMNPNIILDDKNDNTFDINFGEKSNEYKGVEMLVYLNNKNLSELNSFISKKIMGNMKTIFKCEKCKKEIHKSYGYYFLTIDLENIKNRDIENYFKHLNNMDNLVDYCSNCIKQTNITKYEKCEIFPDCLILFIKRGDNSSKASFKLKQNLDLNNLIGEKGKKYKLVGFIKKNYKLKNYIAYIEFKFPNEKKIWYKCERQNVRKSKLNKDMDMLNDPKGEIIMAFYEAEK
jgi:serine/threonine protein kinase